MTDISSGYDSESISEINVENVSSLALDFVVEKEKTSFAPVDIEEQILHERLRAILEEAIFKTEIVILLNNIREFDIRPLIEEAIPENELSVILAETFYVVNNDYVTQPYRIVTRQMINEAKEHPECLTLPELTKVFNIFKNYPQTKPAVKLKVQEVYEKYKKKQLKPPDTIAFLRALYRLKTKFEERLEMTASEKLRRDVMQRTLKKTNQMLKDKIAEVTNKINEEREVFDAIFLEKHTTKRGHQATLELLKSECVNIIKKKIVTSEKQMMKEMTQHKVDFENLSEQAIKAEVEYEDLLKFHMGEEDTLRGKRFKIETTLKSWLAKYDKEVGDRQTDLDDLTQKYEDEKAALAELHKQFDEQEKIYIPLIKMKKTEEEIAFAQKYNSFRNNLAARKIQRWIRVIFKKSKKKKKRR